MAKQTYYSTWSIPSRRSRTRVVLPPSIPDWRGTLSAFAAQISPMTAAALADAANSQVKVSDGEEVGSTGHETQARGASSEAMAQEVHKRVAPDENAQVGDAAIPHAMGATGFAARGVQAAAAARARGMGYQSGGGDFAGGGSQGGWEAGGEYQGEVAPPANAAEMGYHINRVAKDLGVDPTDLATVISYETMGKYSTSIMGGKGGRYMGLIQFGPAERKQYGAYRGQRFGDQMDAVGRYLKDRGLKPGMGIKDIYSTINAGRPGKYGASDRQGYTVARHVNEMMRSEHRGRAKAIIAAAGAGDGGTGGETRADIEASNREAVTHEAAGKNVAKAAEQAKQQAAKSGEQAATTGTEQGVPPNVIGKAKQVVLQGGSVDAFMRSQGYPRHSAWCGDFAASVIKAAGGTPPRGASIASNWRNWGRPASGPPKPGMIAVRKGRGGARVPTGSTGSHVTVVQSYDPKTGTFVGLGGNQSRWRSTYRASAFDFRESGTGSEATNISVAEQAAAKTGYNPRTGAITQGGSGGGGVGGGGWGGEGDVASTPWSQAGIVPLAPGMAARGLIPHAARGTAMGSGVSGNARMVQQFIASINPKYRDMAVRQAQRAATAFSIGKNIYEQHISPKWRWMPGFGGFAPPGGFSGLARQQDMLPEYRKTVQTMIRRGRGAYPGAQRKK